MTKKEQEFILKIKQEMPEFTGTKVEVEKKMAMFIYLYLGKMKVFDEQYFLGNQQEKRIINKKRYSRFNMDKSLERKREVCATLATLYRKILGDFGIEARNYNIDDSCDHVNNKIYFSDKTSIIVDLQRDLTNIQTHRKIKYFGTEKEYGNKYSIIFDEEEIHNLLKECGYVNSKEDYMETKIEQLKGKIENLPPDELLQKIIQDEGINNYQDDIGYIELYSYYSSLIAKIAPNYDRKDINYFNCYVRKTDEIGEEYKDYTMCIYSVYKDEVKAYLYSNKEKAFIPTSLLKLDELESKGFYLGRNSSENGAELLRNYISKEKAKKYKKGTHNVDMTKYI